MGHPLLTTKIQNNFVMNSLFSDRKSISLNHQFEYDIFLLMSHNFESSNIWIDFVICRVSKKDLKPNTQLIEIKTNFSDD